MKYAQVIYKGATDKIGRFNGVETGQTLTLTESEYECVREDARYEFIEWVKVDLPRVQPALAQSPSYSHDRSPLNEDPIKREPSRVSQDIIVSEDEDEDEDEDYSKLTVKELLAEIKARNELLDDEEQIEPASKKKKDLISALEENDENDA